MYLLSPGNLESGSLDHLKVPALGELQAPLMILTGSLSTVAQTPASPSLTQQVLTFRAESQPW